MGKGSNTTTSNSSSSTSADPYAANAYRDLIGRAQGVASTPYQAYSGELVAPVNAQQQAGISNLNANAGFATPFINQAAGLYTGASTPLTSDQITAYQNPYTQAVVDATQAQFNNQNAQQQAQLRGNAISRGALGGNRVGVAEGVLAGQQAAAQAPVIAGLYNTSYQNALQTAQQQFQQNPMNAAYALGNLGISGQNAALSGAQAQIGAGSLQQQTQQAQNEAAYQQYMQQQAYPFQTAQWLAGMTSGLGPLLGSSTSGTSTQQGPQPNQWNQIAGLGLTAAGLFLSDRRAKEDVHKIGEMNDGQPIYRYRYKGSPHWQIGLMAQEVERDHPEAVHSGVGGLKFVDVKEATDDAARPERARGGQVAGVGSMPFADATSWVPKMDITSRGLQSSSLPQAGASQQAASGPALDKLVNQAMDVGDKVRNRFSGPLDISAPGIGGYQPSAVGSVFGASTPLAGVSGLYAHGGGVHMATGGVPREWDHMNGDPSWITPDYGPGYPVAGVGAIPFEDRAMPVREAIASATFDPQGSNYTDFAPTQAMADAAAGRVPLPQPRPDIAGDEPDEAETPAGPGLRSRTLMADRSAVPAAATLAPGLVPDTDMSAQARPADASSERGLLGLPRLSNAAQAGLLTAGLGMLASRSPFLGTGIGEGGLAGVAAYQNVKSAEAKAENEARKSAMDARKLAMEAEKIRADLGLRTRAQALAEQKHQDDQTPTGWDRDPKSGKLFYEPGGPADPEYLARAAAAKKPAATASMDDETAEFLADRVAAGDTRALIGLGRGAQGAENLAKINNIVARKAKEGSPVNPGAAQILRNAAVQAQQVSAARALGTKDIHFGVAEKAMEESLPIALEASRNVPRTQWQAVNKLIQSGQTQVGDPALRKFLIATDTAVKDYARTINPTGVLRESDIFFARKLLSTADSPKAYEAALEQLKVEAGVTRRALERQKKEVATGQHAPQGGDHHDSSASSASATPTAPAKATDREVGKVYMTPKGPAKWMGNGWQVNP